MKTYNLEEKNVNTNIETLVDNNGYRFIDQYNSIPKNNITLTGEYGLRTNIENELTFAYFFQWLKLIVEDKQDIKKIGLMEAFLNGVRACTRFPSYATVYYVLYYYLSKTIGCDGNIDTSIIDDIYNYLIERNNGISMRIQDYDDDFNLEKAIKLIGNKL